MLIKKRLAPQKIKSYYGQMKAQFIATNGNQPKLLDFDDQQ